MIRAMVVDDGALVAAAVLLCVAAAALGIQSLRDTPRCRDCGVPTEAAAAEATTPSPPIVTVTYRCPRCRQVVFRRCIVPWD